MSSETAGQTDEALVLIYRTTGDKRAVGELFKRNSLMCLTVCMKYLKDQAAAEDAAMSVFEKLFSDLKNHDIQNFRSWLHSVSRNYCLMQLRKYSPEIRITPMDDDHENGFMEFEKFLHQEDNTEEKESRLQMLEQSIITLKAPQRTCIELFYLHRKSYEEIAAQTGFSNNEVKSHIQNGKRNLKIALGERGITLTYLLITWIQELV